MPRAPGVSYYAEMIIKASGCRLEDAAQIEEVMRDTIFHSTLDWQTRAQFNRGAKQAWEVVKVLRAKGIFKEPTYA